MSWAIKSYRSGGSSIRQSAAFAMAFIGMLAILIVVLTCQTVQNYASQVDSYSSPWHYKCVGGQCRKREIDETTNSPQALAVCQLSCGEAGTLWPKPTGHLSLGSEVVRLNPGAIELSGLNARSAAASLIRSNVDSLKRNILDLSGGGAPLERASGSGLVVHLANAVTYDDIRLTLNTNENYSLRVEQLEDGRVNATIVADSYFGARHAIETLSQLIVHDDLRNQVAVIREAYIVDGPVYPYRGVLLDTARNFVDKRTILRTIEAMSMSKLNTFHWHITDSQSFPYVSATYPKLSKYGAYTPSKIYSHEDVKEIVEFGLLRGVRVLPEFDAPAHVGEGWQWVGDEATTCFKAEPWRSYCVEPPCGQLNPASEKVYEILEGIYKDMFNDFNPDIFHMGGDEVSVSCWNSSESLRNWMLNKGWDLKDQSFYRLWDHFQTRAYERVKKINNGQDIPIILWTSGLTKEENIKYLDPKQVIVQIWTTAYDRTVSTLLKNNFRVIFSNYDALYLDCGFASWVGEGSNWCAPYKGWHKIYDNSPLNIAAKQGFDPPPKHLILGAEAALWTEQADTSSTDSRIWPRAAAMAERLWSEPQSTWIHAEQRMLRHRERLTRRGVMADALQPEWCMQNQGQC